jgi:hypothetical protein
LSHASAEIVEGKNPVEPSSNLALRTAHHLQQQLT